MTAMGGALLRAWRRRTGRTQEEAARDLGLSRRMLAYYESGQHAAPVTVLLAARALEKGVGMLSPPSRGARERWVAMVSDLTAYAGGEPVVGRLMRARERERLRAFLDMVRTGPDPKLALTDPALFLTLRRGCTRAQMAGLAACIVAPSAPTAKPERQRGAVAPAAGCDPSPPSAAPPA